jgi:geranylgeranylglycerol-phosphate geranylgeranyltransferase
MPTPWIRLLRPGNALIAAAAVWLGWASLTLRPEWQIAFWGSLSMLLMVGGGNADNDALDVETDRVNRPHRPLAAGHIGRGAAWTIAFLLYAGAVLCAWIGSPLHGVLAAAMALLLIAYNRTLKGRPLSGNLAISLLCGLAVYFVELPLLIDFPFSSHDSLPAALFAFLVTFARELVKDAEDVAGDRAAGHRTFAVVKGTEAARRLAFASVVVLLLLIPGPLLYFGYHWYYVVSIVVLGGPVLVPLLGELARTDAMVIHLTRAQKLLKLFMLAGMISLLAGVLGRAS